MPTCNVYIIFTLLYMRYNSIFNFKPKYDIKLLPFGHEEIITRIKKIAEDHDKAKNTILLLDAFDEYKGLLPPKIPDGLLYVAKV